MEYFGVSGLFGLAGGYFSGINGSKAKYIEILRGMRVLEMDEIAVE